MHGVPREHGHGDRGKGAHLPRVDECIYGGGRRALVRRWCVIGALLGHYWTSLVHYWCVIGALLGIIEAVLALLGIIGASSGDWAINGAWAVNGARP